MGSNFTVGKSTGRIVTCHVCHKKKKGVLLAESRNLRVPACENCRRKFSLRPVDFGRKAPPIPGVGQGPPLGRAID